ncbi:MAG TPA: argininosuccinate lyase, partial [Zoogloea sp.]|nr:argininosuccinate lyase [Zoogloea sp.]
DKEPLFDSADTAIDTLRIYADMMGSRIDAATGEKVFNVRVKREAMQAALTQGYATATDLADYLVKKGLPFRDAHEAVALAVRAADLKGVDLPLIPLDELRAAMTHVPGAVERMDQDVFQVLTVEGSLASRNHIGGTAPVQVRAAIARARSRIA